MNSGDKNEYRIPLPYDIVDIHAHFFPHRMFEAVWDFFERNSWRINYKDKPERLAEKLKGFGVSHFTVLNYLHKPGIRDSLAEWTRDFAASMPGAVPFGSVLAGEPGNLAAARTWFDDWGFHGLKTQPLVSRKPIDDPSLYPVYELMAERGKWFIVHAGTAPYPNEFTDLKFLRNLLLDFPDLNAVLAHMGGYDFETALRMMEEFPRLHLDTTMIFVNTYVFDASYPFPVERLEPFEDRIHFGSDFPNIPYDYAEAVDGIVRAGFSDSFMKKIFRDNSRRILSL